MTKYLLRLAFVTGLLITKTMHVSAQELDAAFGSDGVVIRTQPSGIAAVTTQPDGKIVTAGFDYERLHFEIARHHVDGSMDSTFGEDGLVHTPITFSSRAKTVAVQNDGKIIVGGTYYTGDFVHIYHMALVRYQPNGSLDSTFGDNGIVMQEVDYSIELADMELQNDGKIVVGGTVVPLASIAIEHFALARFNVDGSLDSSFGTDGLVRTTSGIASAVTDIALQADGKIIAAGRRGMPSLLEPVYEVKFQLIRYNANGTIDNTFGAEGIVLTDVLDNTPDIISSIALLPDGKIIAAGCWDDSMAIVRYNANGSIDSSFGDDGKAIHPGYPTPMKLTVTEAGNMLVVSTIPYDIEDGGDFILRSYLSNGTIDTDFGDAGKVITNLNGTNTDFASCIYIQPDDKIIVGGSSNDFGAMVRYLSDGTTSTGNVKTPNSVMQCYPNPFVDKIFVSLSGLTKKQLATARLYDISGRALWQENCTLDSKGCNLYLPNLHAGMYILQITGSDGTSWSQKITKQ